jgi:hypothetical protein
VLPVVALAVVVYYTALPVFRQISIFVTLSHHILEITRLSNNNPQTTPGIMSSDPHSEYQVSKSTVLASDTIFSFSPGTASKPR